MIRIEKYFVILGFFLASPLAFSAEVTDVHDRSVCASDGVALGGFDLVSYYQDSGPVLGSNVITAEHDGLTYQFLSVDNRNAFVSDPDQYLPTYLGWCSTNLAMGRLACPDFTNFKIENGKLLLFEHAGFTNGRDIWNADPVLHRRQANANQIKFSQ